MGVCALCGMQPSAQAQDVTHMLMPSNAWLVGPTTLAEGSDVEAAGVPCLMVTSFSNNYEMRISGGGRQIMAMALNVREKGFTPGESYLMKLSFSEDDGFEAPAQAFSEDTLVVGLSQQPDFYKGLSESDALYVTLGDARMQFSLLGVPQGLKRLEQCFQPPTESIREAAVEEDGKQPPAPGLHTLGSGEVDALKDMITDEESPAAPVAVTQEALPASDEGARKKDVQPVQDVQPRDILVPKAGQKGAAVATAPASPRMQWRVMKGGGLEGVLGVWAQSVNMRLIWQAGQSYSVPESLSMQGTFEDVVQKVLEQFPADRPRPVGKIFVDPSTRQKVLLIETSVPAAQMPVDGAYEPILSPQ